MRKMLVVNDHSEVYCFQLRLVFQRSSKHTELIVGVFASQFHVSAVICQQVLMMHTKFLCMRHLVHFLKGTGDLHETSVSVSIQSLIFIYSLPAAP